VNRSFTQVLCLPVPAMRTFSAFAVVKCFYLLFIPYSLMDIIHSSSSVLLLQNQNEQLQELKKKWMI
jgi:hypothetical protein